MSGKGTEVKIKKPVSSARVFRVIPWKLSETSANGEVQPERVLIAYPPTRAITSIVWEAGGRVFLVLSERTAGWKVLGSLLRGIPSKYKYLVLRSENKRVKTRVIKKE